MQLRALVKERMIASAWLDDDLGETLMICPKRANVSDLCVSRSAGLRWEIKVDAPKAQGRSDIVYMTPASRDHAIPCYSARGDGLLNSTIPYHSSIPRARSVAGPAPPHKASPGRKSRSAVELTLAATVLIKGDCSG